jgi:DNA-directed RNA polymerase specialized sigma24 family protein
MADHAAGLADGQITDSCAFQEYLEYLPRLDRQVLRHRHLMKKAPSAIALEMRITIVHVNRILARAQEFNALSRRFPDPLPIFR